jgi:hypothetical protein
LLIQSNYSSKSIALIEGVRRFLHEFLKSAPWKPTICDGSELILREAMEKEDYEIELEEEISDQEEAETARISGASSSLSISTDDDLSEVTELEIVDTTEWVDLPPPKEVPDYAGPAYYEPLILRKNRSPRVSLDDAVFEDVEVLGPGFTPRSRSRTPLKPIEPPKKRPQSASEKLLSQRAFHHKSFVPFRYPLQFHSDGRKPKQKSFIKIPNSFQPRTRYGREPRVQAKRDSDSKSRKWPQCPLYPPKARHAEIMCEIIRLVQTLDLGIQATPQMADTAIQSIAQMTDAATQYPRVRKAEVGCQTLDPDVQDAAIQNVPQMANKMEETSVRILYFPVLNTQHNWTQTDSSLTDCYSRAPSGVPLVTLDSPEGSRVLIQSPFEQDVLQKIEEESSSSDSDRSLTLTELDH